MAQTHIPGESIPEEEIARVEVSVPRRAFALGTLCGLGALLIWLAIAVDSPVLWPRLLFLGAGVLALALALRTWRVTQVGLVLTATALHDSNGILLASVDQIERVERGAFAFKPSNGFLLHLNTKLGGVWRPGLWWRQGRKLGVGGVCNGAQTRAMADIIAIQLVREGRGPR